MTSRREFLQSLLVAGTTVTLAPQILLPAKLSDAECTTELKCWGQAVQYDLGSAHNELSALREMLAKEQSRFAHRLWQDQHAYLIPESVLWIHKPLGSAGTIDPINQYGSIAWKAYGFSAPAWMSRGTAARVSRQLWTAARLGHTKIARMSYGVERVPVPGLQGRLWGRPVVNA